jgi:4-hydroxy-3-methylbut-2-enyl diphosphate reductase
MRLEAVAVRLGAPRSRLARIGMGAARAEAARRRLSFVLEPSTGVALLGVAGAFKDSDRPGDVVVATEVTTADGTGQPTGLDTALAERIAGELSGRFDRVRLGTVVSSRTLVLREQRVLIGESGAACCDMESAWLAGLSDERPFLVVRVILDCPSRELFAPATLTGGLVALRRLAGVASIVDRSLSRATVAA